MSLLGISAAAQAVDDVTESTSRRCADARIANAWRVLRAIDCARCHGKDYSGLAAPSIVAYAANQSREKFRLTILDGDPVRGMPGYRDNAHVAENLDDIYGYFLARANREIGPDYRPPKSSEAIAAACAVGDADVQTTGR